MLKGGFCSPVDSLVNSTQVLSYIFATNAGFSCMNYRSSFNIASKRTKNLVFLVRMDRNQKTSRIFAEVFIYCERIEAFT